MQNSYLSIRFLAVFLLVQMFCWTDSFSQIASLQTGIHNKELEWKLSGEYLLWQISMEGLDIAADNAYIDYFPPAHRGRSYGVSFPWKSGVQIGVGAIFPESQGTELELVYSWLYPVIKENISTDPVVQTFPFYSVKPTERLPNSQVFVVDHLATFQSYYNLLDFRMGRENQIVPAFRVTPYLGLRSTWQKQLWDTNLQMFTQNPVISNYIYNYIQNFQGAGPLFGGRFKFFFLKKYPIFENFALIGNISLAGILGNIQVDSMFSAVSPLSNLFYSSNQKTIFTIVPVWDLSVGLLFEKIFSKGTKVFSAIRFNILWETQSWIGFNKMQSSVVYFSTPSSMTVQGLTAGLGLVF